jgi:hypothetical protein
MNGYEGKLILANALNDVLSFRSQIVSGVKPVSSALEAVARDLRSIQRHQLFLDGGKSCREFFSLGDAMINKLQDIPKLIEMYHQDA